MIAGAEVRFLFLWRRERSGGLKNGKPVQCFNEAERNGNLRGLEISLEYLFFYIFEVGTLVKLYSLKSWNSEGMQWIDLDNGWIMCMGNVCS